MAHTHTRFSCLSDDELTRLVRSSVCSQLEIELAQRLEDIRGEIAEIIRERDADFYPHQREL